MADISEEYFIKKLLEKGFEYNKNTTDLIFKKDRLSICVFRYKVKNQIVSVRYNNKPYKSFVLNNRLWNLRNILRLIKRI